MQRESTHEQGEHAISVQKVSTSTPFSSPPNPSSPNVVTTSFPKVEWRNVRFSKSYNAITNYYNLLQITKLSSIMFNYFIIKIAYHITEFNQFKERIKEKLHSKWLLSIDFHHSFHVIDQAFLLHQSYVPGSLERLCCLITLQLKKSIILNVVDVCC